LSEEVDMGQSIPEAGSAASDLRSNSLYDMAFARTVLRLHGLAEQPTYAQWAFSQKFVKLFHLRVQVMKFHHAATGGAPLHWSSSPSSAIEQAFMLVRFDSVLVPSGEQRRMIHEWLESQQEEFPPLSSISPVTPWNRRAGLP
jgi:hypothetical protein